MKKEDTRICVKQIDMRVRKGCRRRLYETEVASSGGFDFAQVVIVVGTCGQSSLLDASLLSLCTCNTVHSKPAHIWTFELNKSSTCGPVFRLFLASNCKPFHFGSLFSV